MEIYNLYPGSYASNCYVLMSGTHACVIDPSTDAHIILDFLNRKGAALDFIVATHGHFDHLMSADSLRSLTGAPLMIHESDAPCLSDGEKNAYSVFFCGDKRYQPSERILVDGERISLGEKTLTVINTPGHTSGCICLLCQESLFTGDTLFSDSIGRLDLYSGSVSDMRASIEKLRRLDPKLKIYPGHGDTAILGHALDVVSYYF